MKHWQRTGFIFGVIFAVLYSGAIALRYWSMAALTFVWIAAAQ